MKNTLKIFICFFSVLLFCSCSSEDKLIDNVFNNVQSGGALRTIQVNQANFNFYDTSSKWSVTLEEQDATNGAIFSGIKMYATQIPGSANSKEVFVKTIPATSFSPAGANKYPTGEVSVTLAEVLTALNLTTGDYAPTDKFNLRLELILTNGRTFSADNTSSSITAGSYFSSPFQYSAQFSCPLNNASLFNGNYKVVADAWGDYSPGDIVPVVYDPSNSLFTFRILNTNNPYLVNYKTAYLIVTINPADNSAKVISNQTYNYGGGFKVDVTGDGTIGSCTGDINLKLDFSGNSQNQTFSLVKVK